LIALSLRRKRSLRRREVGPQISTVIPKALSTNENKKLAELPPVITYFDDKGTSEIHIKI
jgi:hypothetical protein